jgi:hypothetical protein
MLPNTTELGYDSVAQTPDAVNNSVSPIFATALLSRIVPPEKWKETVPVPNCP